MRILLFLLLPFMAVGQCDYETFPILGGNVFQGGIERGMLIQTEVNGLFNIEAKGFQIKRFVPSGGYFQYNWSIQKAGRYGFVPLARTCSNNVVVNAAPGDIIMVRVWYFNGTVGADDTYIDRYPETIILTNAKYQIKNSPTEAGRRSKDINGVEYGGEGFEFDSEQVDRQRKR